MKINLPDQLSFLANYKRPQKHYNEKAENKTVVLTGATSGIGYKTALHFSKMGANLIFIVRNKNKGETLQQEILNKYNTRSKLYIADFKKLSSLNKTLNTIISENKKIDILINNAGAFRTKKKILKTNICAVMTVNHLASFLITQRLLPILKSNNGARILNINSEGHRFGNIDLDDMNWKKRIYTGLRSYGASKSAQLHSMYIQHKILSKSGITINSMHPGAVKSNIGSHSSKLYKLYHNNIINPLLKDPQISAEAIYYLTMSNDLQTISGKFFNLTNIEIPAPHAQESAFSQEVYDKTLEILSYENL